MEENYAEAKKNYAIAIAALVCGVVSLIINPWYLTSLTAIVLGIVGLTQHNGVKGMSLAGLLVGAGGAIVYSIVSVVLSMLGIVWSTFFSAFLSVLESVMYY